MNFKFLALLFVLGSINVNALTNLTACGLLSISGEYYNLLNNVSAAGDCFTVTAQNVTLDCKGFGINFTGNVVSGIITSKYNTTIQNCWVNRTTGGGSTTAGISLLNGASYATIYNTTVIVSHSTSGNTIYALRVKAGVGHKVFNSMFSIKTTTTSIVSAIYVSNSACLESVSGISAFVTQSSSSGSRAFSSASISYVIINDSVFSTTSSQTADFVADYANCSNCSFTKSILALTEVNVFQYVDVHTINSTGDDLGSVTINESNVNGTSVFNGTTNATGWLERQTILIYTQLGQDLDTIVNYTPHWFNASKAGYASNNSETIISENHVGADAVIIALNAESLIAPNVSLVAPLDEAWQTSKTVNFTFIPTDDTGFRNCTTELWYGNETLLNSTNWNASNIVNGSVNWIQYTFAADDYYLWTILCYDLNGLSNNDSLKYWTYVDSTPPSIQIDSPLNDSSYYYFNPLSINVTCEDNLDEVDTVYTNDSHFDSDRTSPYRLNNVTDLSMGGYTVDVFCNDSAGNVNSSTVYFILDEPLEIIDIALNSSSVDFSGLMPGDDVIGSTNSFPLQLTIYNTTNVAVNLSVRGFGNYTSDSSDFDLANLLYGNDAIYSCRSNMTTEFDDGPCIEEHRYYDWVDIPNEDFDQYVSIFYWLRVSTGQLAGIYNTTLYVKVEKA